MDSLLKYSVALDIDKKHLHVCMVSLDNQQHIKICGQRKFDNAEPAFKELSKWIEKKYRSKEIPLSITLEATGVYHEKVARYLYEQDYTVHVVLPNKAKNYMKSLGLKSKTDKIDARGLAQMGAEQKLRCWQPISALHCDLKSLTRHKERLEVMKTDARNQLESVKHSAVANDLVINSLNELMSTYKEQAKLIEKQIKQLLKQEQTDLAKDAKFAMSIPGIGPLISAVTLSETGSFKDFRNERQLVSFCGYDVVQKQSGSRRGRTHISKQGNSHIRRALHLAAWRVVALEVPHFTNLFNRVYERTGVKMKAYVAVQRKLLCTMYALVKKQELFDADYHIEKEEVLTEEPQVLQI